MWSMLASFFAVAGVILGVASASSALSTPESAVRAFEDALIRKDIEAAVAAKDFDTEARLMLKKINPELASDSEILKQTAQVLELGFRKEIETDGFPDFTGLTCSLSKATDVAENLVKMVETCVRASGKTTVQNLFAFKGKNGWRVVVVGE
jgi:hypothetical protein